MRRLSGGANNGQQWPVKIMTFQTLEFKLQIHTVHCWGVTQRFWANQRRKQVQFKTSISWFEFRSLKLIIPNPIIFSEDVNDSKKITSIKRWGDYLIEWLIVWSPAIKGLNMWTCSWCNRLINGKKYSISAEMCTKFQRGTFIADQLTCSNLINIVQTRIEEEQVVSNAWHAFQQVLQTLWYREAESIRLKFANSPTLTIEMGKSLETHFGHYNSRIPRGFSCATLWQSQSVA